MNSSHVDLKLLREFLQTAVPLWTIRFMDLPWEDLKAIMRESGKVLEETGELAAFAAVKKGETARVFNAVAKAVAALSFMPSGIDIFGLHFETKRQGPAMGAGPRDFDQNDIIAPKDKLRDWIPWALIVDKVDGDGTLHAFPLGGGPHFIFDPVKVETYDFVKVPAKLLDNPNWYSTEFYAEWIDKKYRGWTTGRRWNGWAMPYFEFEEAMRYAKDSGNTRYEPELDAFVTVMEGQEDDPGVDEATVIRVRGRGPIKTYPIGAGSWTWSEWRGDEGSEELEGARRVRRRPR